MDTFTLHGRRHFLFLRRTDFRCGKEPPLQGPPYFTTHHARVRPSPSQEYGRGVRHFDIAAWERERENIVLVGSYAKFAQHPVMQSHVLDTGDRLLAEASPYYLMWGIGYRADGVSARQPPPLRGLNWLGKTLQTVRRLFRDRAPSSTRHQLCFLRVPRPPEATACSRLTFYATATCYCVQVTRQQPPLVGLPRLSTKCYIGPRRRRSCCDIRRPLQSTPSHAHRGRALSCCSCSNDERLFLHHQKQDPQVSRCRVVRLCRPLEYKVAIDLYQHSRAREHDTRGCCL